MSKSPIDCTGFNCKSLFRSETEIGKTQRNFPVFDVRAFPKRRFWDGEFTSMLDATDFSLAISEDLDSLRCRAHEKHTLTLVHPTPFESIALLGCQYGSSASKEPSIVCFKFENGVSVTQTLDLARLTSEGPVALTGIRFTPGQADKVWGGFGKGSLPQQNFNLTKFRVDRFALHAIEVSSLGIEHLILAVSGKRGRPQTPIPEPSPIFDIVCPLTLNGFNRSIILPRDSLPPFGGYSTVFDDYCMECFYEEGLVGTTKGLPSSGVIHSLIDGTPFRLQPYNKLNALILSSLSSNSLVLRYPRAYSKLYILACSVRSCRAELGTVVIVFLDGSESKPIPFDASDWLRSGNVAYEGCGLMNVETELADDSENVPKLFQTAVDMDALGLNLRKVRSLKFTGPEKADQTAIFAVSGLAAHPSEPAVAA